MNYTLNQLQVFLKVVQHQSVSAAANELYLTQPAVSMQLKNFQSQFDIALTETIGRKIYITEFGREIARAAEKILDEVEAINYKANAHKGLLTGKLRVSVVTTGMYVMPYFMTEFMKKYKNIELVIDISNKTRVVDNFERNAVDFALVSIPPEQLPLNKFELMPNKLYLIGKPISDGQLPADQLAEFLKTIPLIYRERTSGTRVVMERFIQENHIQVNRKMVLSTNEAIKQAIIAGLGYSIMPLIGIKREIQNRELVVIPVKGLPIQNTWSLIWHKDKILSPVAQAYLEFLQSEKDKIIEEHFAWVNEFDIENS